MKSYLQQNLQTNYKYMIKFTEKEINSFDLDELQLLESEIKASEKLLKIYDIELKSLTEIKHFVKKRIEEILFINT